MGVKKLTKKEAVSVCYAAMILADGKVEQNEVQWTSKSSIATRYEVDKNLRWIIDYLKDDKLEELTSQLPTPTLKRMSMKERNEIAIDLMLLGSSDGEVHENEANIMIPIYGLLGGTMDEYGLLIKEMQATKKQKSSKTGNCFIATATMGDYDHPIVLDLRNFRDNVLKKSIAGRLFIKIYYTIGPIPAFFVGKSRYLRIFSYKFLIKPLHRLISKLY